MTEPDFRTPWERLKSKIEALGCSTTLAALMLAVWWMLRGAGE